MNPSSNFRPFTYGSVMILLVFFILTASFIIMQDASDNGEHRADRKPAELQNTEAENPDTDVVSFKTTSVHEGYSDSLFDKQQQTVADERESGDGSGTTTIPADLQQPTTIESVLRNTALEFWGTEEPVVDNLPFPGERNPVLNDDLENVLREEGVTPTALSRLKKEELRQLLEGTRISLEEFLRCIAPYVERGGEEEVDGVEREQARHIERLRQLVRNIIQ
jgi:hypothetical protein